MSNEKEKVFIRCIGIDGKQHICEPHKDICKCGVKVDNKKPLRDDYNRCGCYECDY